jgi:hypothetical protein
MMVMALFPVAAATDAGRKSRLLRSLLQLAIGREEAVCSKTGPLDAARLSGGRPFGLSGPSALAHLDPCACGSTALGSGCRTFIRPLAHAGDHF